MTTAIKTMLASALALAASGAMAADAIDVVPAPIAPVAAPFTWTGAYVGVEGGYGFADFSNVSETTGTPLTGAFRETLLGQELDGFLVGAFAGANVQLGAFVLGVDGSIDYANIDGSASFAAAAGRTDTVDVEIDMVANARARAGYAFGRVLPYVTAGVAFASVDLDYTSSFAPDVSADDTFTGYTVGAGVDYAFGERAFARLDYAYSDFGDGFDLQNAQTFSTELDDLHTVKLGVALKF